MAEKQKIIEKHKMSIDWPCVSLYKWQPEHSFKISATRRALMRRKMLNEGGPIKISCQQTKQNYIEKEKLDHYPRPNIKSIE